MSDSLLLLTPERLEEFGWQMEQMASGHAGANNVLGITTTDFDTHPIQHPDNNFAPTHPVKREANGQVTQRLDLDFFIQAQQALVPNNLALIEEGKVKLAGLIAQLEELRFGQRLNVVLAGDHQTVDNIIHPPIVLGAIARARNLATDRPEQRLVPMAKALAWYKFVGLYGIDLVQNMMNVVTSAPSTIGGVDVPKDIRDHINERAEIAMTTELDRGEREMTIALDGQTLRVIENRVPKLVRGTNLRLAFSASNGTVDMLTRSDVVVVPFSTYQVGPDQPMSMAFGEPRQLKSDPNNPTVAAEEVHRLGLEISYLGKLTSGLTTLLIPVRGDFKAAADGKNPHGLTVISDYAKAYREATKAARDGRNHYVIGPAALEAV